MFKNYIKTAWRNLTRRPGYSTLNIFGLGIGMAVALLIGLWVHHQFSYDKFLPDGDRLYRVQVLIVQFALASFNQMAETTIEIPFGNIYFWLILATGIAVTSLIAGGRPAFLLSSFKPIKVLRYGYCCPTILSAW